MEDREKEAKQIIDNLLKEYPELEKRMVGLVLQSIKEKYKKVEQDLREKQKKAVNQVKIGN